LIKFVRISASARKDLGSVAYFIVDKLLAWVKRIEQVGIEEVRKVKGYHDEPLHGKRLGQRCIRLSRAYRAIYLIKRDGSVEFVNVEEVNKHDY
jgi:proteic killer suppression protein